LELNKVNKILNQNEILHFQELVRKVPVAQNVIDYAVKLVTATRPGSENKLNYIKDWIRWGAGPRASQYLILAAKVRAALVGKVTPDLSDIKETAHSILRHRLVITYHAEAENVTVSDIIDRLLGDIE
jgi:MoxR-like ATPase